MKFTDRLIISVVILIVMVVVVLTTANFQKRITRLEVISDGVFSGGNKVEPAR